MIFIPDNCKFIFENLIAAGFKCYAVGGCVRDSLMGRTPADWDFTTDASPSQIESCFLNYKTLDIGKNFGTITVINGADSFEVTTFRCDGSYSDSRHPDSVTFASSVEEDLSRRDFTMNSIAYSPDEGLIDPFDGYSDIKNEIIRCTSEPFLRFQEDAIRIIRALRFASVLSFEIEEKTCSALISLADTLSKVHPYRIRKELNGLLLGDDAVQILNDFRDVIAVIIPEIKPMFDFKQNNPHHKYDVWLHTLNALKNTPATELHRLTVLFHDIGKPYMKTTDKKGIDHFKQHQQKSADVSKDILRRFGYSSALSSDVLLLIRYHDERFRELRYDVKRMLGILGERLFFILTDVMYSDIMGQSKYKRGEKLSYRDLIISSAKQIIADGECVSLKELAVNGNDLILLGFKGSRIGTVLNKLLDLVLRDLLSNTKEELLDYASKIVKIAD